MITTTSQEEGMAEERRLLQENFPGWRLSDAPGLDYWNEMDEGGAFGVYRIQLPDRTTRYVYFDIWSYMKPGLPRPTINS